jgi:hypothetical protein
MGIYDPRKDSEIDETNNPALIFAHIMVNSGLIFKKDWHKFWKKISFLADYCDQKVNNKKPKKLKLKTKKNAPKKKTVHRTKSKKKSKT